MSRSRKLLVALLAVVSIACAAPASSLAATSNACSSGYPRTCVTAEQAIPGYLSYMTTSLYIDSCYKGYHEVIHSIQAPTTYYREWSRQLFYHPDRYGCGTGTDLVLLPKTGKVDLMVPKGAVACSTVYRVNANGSRTFLTNVCAKLV